MRALALLLLAALPACATLVPAAPGPQQQFFDRLRALCGHAYRGRVVSSDAADREMAAARLVMQVRACSASEIRIPFHVGDDRSRVWVVTRTAGGPAAQARAPPSRRQRGRAQPIWRRHRRGRQCAAAGFPGRRLLARPLRARGHPGIDHQRLGDRDRAGPRPSPMSCGGRAAISGSSSTSPRRSPRRRRPGASAEHPDKADMAPFVQSRFRGRDRHDRHDRH